MLASALCGHVGAENYPEKAVTMVVPFPAGGSVDLVARTLAQRMSELWAQPVVIVNRAGAGGNIGAESVAHAAPDGYNLLIGSTALAISPSLYRKLGYDVLKDLAPVSHLVTTPNLLVVHPSVPARSVRELVALAKRKPGVLKSASAGAGSSNHLALVLFNSLAGVRVEHIPYKGAAPAVADVVGGHVEMTFVPIPAAVSLVQAGKLRALAVSTIRRSTVLPDVPTIAESGIPGYESSSWTVLMAPGGTPRSLVMRVHAAGIESLNAPQVRDVLAKTGAEPVGSSPEDVAKLLRDEMVKWGKVMKAAGEDRR
jgi:tripartite-type tricarboxylate transporter receptor subunit TctC